MGYLTSYRLLRTEEPPLKACPTCHQVEKRHTFLSAIRNVFDGSPFEDRWSWYEHEADITRAMAMSGATRVEISGLGEDGDSFEKTFTVDGSDVVIECRRRGPGVGTVPTGTSTTRIQLPTPF
jgi:hypothetical protein